MAPSSPGFTARYRAIDILNRADGITFDEAAASPASFEVEGRRIPVIGLAALLKNKRTAARPQDLADVSALEAALAARHASGER